MEIKVIELVNLKLEHDTKYRLYPNEDYPINKVIKIDDEYAKKENLIERYSKHPKLITIVKEITKDKPKKEAKEDKE